MSVRSGIGAIICFVAAFMHDVPAAIQRLNRFVGPLLTLSFLKRRQSCSRSSIRTETAYLTGHSAQIRLRSKTCILVTPIAHHADKFVLSPWVRTLRESRFPATALCGEGLGVILNDDDSPSHRPASSSMNW